MSTEFAPTRQAAWARVQAIRPADYARTRNELSGAVTGLSPYLTHGVLHLPEVLSHLVEHHALNMQHKLVFEFGWREYFRHLWQVHGDAIFGSLHPGPLADEQYGNTLPADIREARTGIPVIDMAVRTLYQTGYLHNHARMWLASHVVHVRKVHWRAGADWMYGHLLDGDLASNHLSWQWVAGTASSKPYLFNADNVARFAPSDWHSPGTVIDQSYEALDRLARSPKGVHLGRGHQAQGLDEPSLSSQPDAAWGFAAPSADAVQGQEVWLVHPWNLSDPPPSLSAGTVSVGLLLTDFHQNWPWSEARWRFVCSRMADICDLLWIADAHHIATALQAARQVTSVSDPHLHPWLAHWAQCQPAPAIFPQVKQPCASFSTWWHRVSRHRQ